MGNQELVRYVGEQAAKGTPVEKIRANLRSVGWSEADVEAALSESGNGTLSAELTGDLAKDFAALRTDFMNLSARFAAFDARLRAGSAASSAVPAISEGAETQPASIGGAYPDGKVTTTGEPTESLESKVTGKWFAVVGIVALLFGVGFFFKYAFDNNWIGPTGRILLGVVAGLALLLLGDFLSRRERYLPYSFFLSGGGLALLYLSIYAGYAYYEKIAQPLAFIYLIMITALGTATALRHGSKRLLAMALLGGFLTPFLVSSGVDNQVGLMGYILVLNLAFLGMSYFKKWQEIYVLNFFGTYFTFFIWMASYYDKTKLAPTMAFLTAYYLIFLLAPFLMSYMRGRMSEQGDVLTAPLNMLAYFPTAYFILSPDYEPYLGFFFAGWAALALAFAYGLSERNPEDRTGVLALGGTGLVLATVAIPIQFSAYWITIAWALEGLLLTWFGLSLGSKKIRVFAMLVFIIMAFRLLAFDTSLHAPVAGFVPIMNERFMTYLVGIGALFAAVYLLNRTRETLSAEERSLHTVLSVGANLLAVIMLSMESSSYFARQEELAMRAARPGGVYGSADYDYQYNSATHRSFDNQRNLALSVIWGLYAASLMATGFLRRIRALRLMGIVGLCIVILKVFFVDMQALSELYRIISFIGLGGILLAVSFLFYRYKDKIKELIMTE